MKKRKVKTLMLDSAFNQNCAEILFVIIYSWTIDLFLGSLENCLPWYKFLLYSEMKLLKSYYSLQFSHMWTVNDDRLSIDNFEISALKCQISFMLLVCFTTQHTNLKNVCCRMRRNNIFNINIYCHLFFELKKTPMLFKKVQNLLNDTSWFK